MSFLNKIRNLTDLILKDQTVSFLKIFQHHVDLVLCNCLVCAAVQNNTVVSFSVFLNHCVARADFLADLKITGIHLCLTKNFSQKRSICPYDTRMIDICPGSAQGNGLVKPLPSGKYLKRIRRNSLSLFYKMTYAINIIDI